MLAGALLLNITGLAQAADMPLKALPPPKVDAPVKKSTALTLVITLPEPVVLARIPPAPSETPM